MKPSHHVVLTAIQAHVAAMRQLSYRELAAELGMMVKSDAYTPAALDSLDTTTLKGLVAHASGLLAYRIGDRLVGRPRVRAA